MLDRSKYSSNELKIEEMLDTELRKLFKAIKELPLGLRNFTCMIDEREEFETNLITQLKSKTPLPEPSKDAKQVVIDELKQHWHIRENYSDKQIIDFATNLLSKLNIEGLNDTISQLQDAIANR